MHSFIKFPRSVQTVEFSDTDAPVPSIRTPHTESRTSDGLEVKLEISFQYSLISEGLFNLYMNFALDYPYIIQNVAVDVLSDLTTNYTAYNFFMDRGRIGTEMQVVSARQALDTTLRRKVSAICEFFQLRSVDLPDDFENAIQMSEVKKQDIQKAEAERSRTQVEIKTKLMTADLNRNVTIVSST